MRQDSGQPARVLAVDCHCCRADCRRQPASPEEPPAAPERARRLTQTYEVVISVNEISFRAVEFRTRLTAPNGTTKLFGKEVMRSRDLERSQLARELDEAPRRPFALQIAAPADPAPAKKSG